MTRNMIATNSSVFSRLYAYVVEHLPDRAVLKGRRHIITDDNDKDWLRNIQVAEKQSIVGNVQAAKLLFQGEEYFTFVGWDDSQAFAPDVLDPGDLNAGIVTALLSELTVPVRQGIDANQIADQVFYQMDEDDGTTRSLNQWAYDYRQVSSFFYPILFYSVPKNSPLRGGDLNQIAGYFVSQQAPDRLVLPFTEKTLKIFEKAFLEGSPSLPFENLLVGLTSTHWKFTFLDVYRCIERLFAVPFLDDFHRVSGAALPFFDFAAKMEELVGWKPKEEDALNRLVDADSIPPEAKSLLDDVKRSLGHSAAAKLGSGVYKVRNSIVHQKPATPVMPLDNEHWNKLVSATLLIVVHWYDQYAGKLTPSNTYVAI